ncbi:MAG: glycosyl hydrolase, partial [Thermoanaerobaculia bacterium]
MTLALCLLFAPVVDGQPEAEPAVDPALFQGMEWRLIGPFRGGRATAVAGVRSQPLTFYFGATGGGVWKTEDAGTTWHNVTDGHVGTGSVGAVAVAESDPNVVYAGMGEAQIRGVASSHGDGVYRSTDGGATWNHLGLTNTRQISRIRVHPGDPDLVYVAAQGSPWKANRERGIYRSRDGGRTWLRILYVDDQTGASDLAMDPTNPRVLYTGLWQHWRMPWKIDSGGPGSGLYKTTDGGDSWEELSDGLPELMGKIGVAVSPARPERLWTIIEAEDGGLFRSDDGGEKWRLINRDRKLRARAWYYTKVFADPRDADTV